MEEEVVEKVEPSRGWGYLIPFTGNYLLNADCVAHVV